MQRVITWKTNWWILEFPERLAHHTLKHKHTHIYTTQNTKFLIEKHSIHTSTNRKEITSSLKRRRRRGELKSSNKLEWKRDESLWKVGEEEGAANRRGGRALNSFRWTRLLPLPLPIPWDKLVEPACLRITSQRYTGRLQRNPVQPSPPLLPFCQSSSLPRKLATGSPPSPPLSRARPPFPRPPFPAKKSPFVHPPLLLFPLLLVNQLIPPLFFNLIGKEKGGGWYLAWFPWSKREKEKGGVFDSRRS